MKTVRVYHGLYGCDTGCCGHYVEIDGKARFGFVHKYEESESDLDFAKRVAEQLFGAAHCADLDWSHATVAIDRTEDGEIDTLCAHYEGR